MSKLSLKEAWASHIEKRKNIGPNVKEEFEKGWLDAEKDDGQSGLVRGIGSYCDGWNSYVRNNK